MLKIRPRADREFLAAISESELEALLSQRERTSNIAVSYGACKRHFDMLNRLGVDHDCGRQTDRQTDRRGGQTVYKAI